MQSFSRKRQLGLVLVFLSFGFYGALILVPFSPFSAGGKLQLSAGLIIIGEASFWIAVLILGKEMASKYRHIDLRKWLGFGAFFPAKESETKKIDIKNDTDKGDIQVNANLER